MLERVLAPSLTLRLLVYHVSQDDPKKNTARKLARFELCELTDRIDRIPRGAILLDPYAEKALSREDEKAARERGVVALDCSWKHAEETFPHARERTAPRGLPVLWAANPVNYGKPFQLSTAESLAAACILLGERAQAESLMSKFIWGETFLALNEKPLEDYERTSTSREIVDAMQPYLIDEAPPTRKERRLERKLRRVSSDADAEPDQ